MGFNKWESMDTLRMERCPELREALPGPDWWRVALPLPELLFRVDYVTVDTRSGAVDNNGCVHRAAGGQMHLPSQLLSRVAGLREGGRPRCPPASPASAPSIAVQALLRDVCTVVRSCPTPWPEALPSSPPSSGRNFQLVLRN